MGQPEFLTALERADATYAALDAIERGSRDPAELAAAKEAVDAALADLRRLEAELPAVPSAHNGVGAWNVGAARVILRGDAVVMVAMDAAPTAEAYALAARIAAAAAELASATESSTEA